MKEMQFFPDIEQCIRKLRNNYLSSNTRLNKAIDNNYNAFILQKLSQEVENLSDVIDLLNSLKEGLTEAAKYQLMEKGGQDD